MAKRYDYRRELKELSLEALKSVLSKSLDRYTKGLSLGAENIINYEGKRIDYMRKRISLLSK